MSLLLPSDDTLYAALVARDAAYDGHAFVGVTTTGIFCCLSCPARKPKRENSRFFASVAACFEAGFRPCQRCRPLELFRRRDPLVADLLDRLDQAPETPWCEDAIAALGYDASTVRRAFKRAFGMTFLELARVRRLGQGVGRLATEEKVIDAQMAAGFGSSSGFREAVGRLLGETPAALRGRTLLFADWVETPLGAMLAVSDTQALHLLEFFDRKALLAELTRLRTLTGSGITFDRTAVHDQVTGALSTYFATGIAPQSLRLAPAGSPFNRRVWAALRELSPGETLSYGALAESMATPGGARAVARAVGANPIALFIPCHRIIGQDGSMTGYGGGLWRKRWLLTHEARVRNHVLPSETIQ